jgi:ferredoxin
MSCGACEAEFQNDAISKGDGIYVINPAKYIECFGNSDRPMCAEIYPADVCVADLDREESKNSCLRNGISHVSAKHLL